jgi:hypothetical protein
MNVTLVVPITEQDDWTLRWTATVLRPICDKFGGMTVLPGVGYWLADKGTRRPICEDKVRVVWCCSPDNSAGWWRDKALELLDVFKQDCIFYTLDGEGHFIGRSGEEVQ